MKVCLAVILLIPSVLAGQQSATLPGAATVEIRSTDTSRVLTVAVDVQVGLFGSLGVLRPAPGEVHCGQTGCTATTPAVLELAPGVGQGRLSVPDTSAELEITVIAMTTTQRRLLARGHTISFSRTDRGELRIIAPRIDMRF